MSAHEPGDRTVPGAQADAAGRRVTVRPWTPADLAGFLALRPQVYPGWHAAGDDEWHLAVYRWLETAPDADRMARWVIDDRGRVVGHLAAVPLRYRIAGRRVVAWTPTDYMALPGYGFHAVGLMRTFYRTFPDAVSCNVAGEVSGIEGLFGATVVAPLVRALKVLDVARYPRLPGGIAGAAVSLGAPVVGAVDRVLLAGMGRGVAVERVSAFGPEFDELLERLAAAVACVPEKDAAFLRWRYGEGTPRGPMLVLAARDQGSLAGYAVLRVGETGEAFLLDAMTLPGRRGVARALLRAVSLAAWAARAFVLRYRFLPSSVSPGVGDLRRAGFLVRAGGGPLLPGTQPERPLELLVRFTDPATSAAAGSPGGWAYNQGDGEASFWVP